MYHTMTSNYLGSIPVKGLRQDLNIFGHTMLTSNIAQQHAVLQSF